MIYKFLYYLFFSLRIIVPPFIFFNPLLIIFVSTVLDIIDVEFASKNVLSLKEYELKDKFLDWW